MNGRAIFPPASGGSASKVKKFPRAFVCVRRASLRFGAGRGDGEGSEALSRAIGHRRRLPRADVDLHDHGLRGGGAAAVLEDGLFELDRAAPDARHARADLHRAGPEDLVAEVEYELRDDELASGRGQRVVRREEHLDAARFQVRGEDSVVDVALAVGVAVAELVGGQQREVVDRRERHGDVG